MVVGREEAIREAVRTVASLMVAAAVTAPKAKGVDNIEVVVIDDRDELLKLAEKMDELASVYGSFFSRDADCVRRSDAVVVIGAWVPKLSLKTPPEYGVDADTAMALINLGIALGSAVKVASMLNVDTRIMFSIGVAARALGLLRSPYVLGVPLSVKGKNIYFDRKPRSSAR